MKICIWMNIPSHHQSAFFNTLSNIKDIDLQVRYYEKVSEARKKLGWNNQNDMLSYEKHLDNVDNIENSLLDWEERIHIIPGFSSIFLKKLLELVIHKEVMWIHWSERSGVGLATLLNFNYKLINIFYPPFLYLKGYKTYAKQVNNYALGTFAIGELAKKDFLQWGIKNEKIKFLPYSLNGLKKPKKLPIKLKKSDEYIFMYLGSLYELKGMTILLKSFQKLTNVTDKWKLVLVGDDRSNGKYAQYAIELGIADKVEFTGIVESTNVNAYLDQADVFVLPTLFDGWGAVLNEAISLAKPLISTDQAGASHHLIEDGQNGFIVKAGNEDSLSEAMQYYIDNPTEIDMHGKKSLEIFQNFTPKKSAELFIHNIYEFLEKNNETVN